MNENTPFLILEQACEPAIDWLIHCFDFAGLQVVRTFDLHDTRSHLDTHASCPCPYHGTEQCDCQMVVLLVYSRGRQPVSLVAHGHHGQTWFSLVDTPHQRADPHTEAAIRLALAPVIGKGYRIESHG